VVEADAGAVPGAVPGIGGAAGKDGDEGGGVADGGGCDGVGVGSVALGSKPGCASR
jgi:hypothetical protein